jgi:hypothetical protein
MGPRSSTAELRQRLAKAGPNGLLGRAGWSSVVEVLQLARSERLIACSAWGCK